jgi:hypothetical protein
VTDALLKAALEAAVPLWIEEIRLWSEDRRIERARACGQVIAEKGDVVQFKGKKRGESANAFNRLAEGIACAAFQPGGIRVLGLHFEATSDNARRNT